MQIGTASFFRAEYTHETNLARYSRLASRLDPRLRYIEDCVTKAYFINRQSFHNLLCKLNVILLQSKKLYLELKYSYKALFEHDRLNDR